MPELPNDVSRDKPLRAVGIGASAGGIDALSVLLPRLTPDEATVYLLALHRPADHEDRGLLELLRTFCAFPVELAADGQALRPGRLYLVPSGHDASVAARRLHLRQADDAGQAGPSVDRLFESLAADFGSHAIGVVLSGTMRDGTAGCLAVCHAGGRVLVEMPAETAQPGMVESVIAAGAASEVLGLHELADALNAIAREEAVSEAWVEHARALAELAAIFADGSDFNIAGYKSGTVLRQVMRRVAETESKDIEAYLTVLRTHPEEVLVLRQRMLVSVTAFFRDAEVYEALGKTIEALVAEKQDGDPLRVWVPGCATGEEAYSIAILIADKLGPRWSKLDVHIFATDLDERALAGARRGLYSLAAIDAVPSRLRARYFDVQGSHAQIRKLIRERCVFATHDLLGQPPFIGIDLLSCRNLLIYLQPAQQAEALARFHYALNDKGILVLGATESAGSRSPQFHTLDAANRIYRKIPGHHAMRLPFLSSRHAAAMPSRAPAQAPSAAASIEFAVENALFSQYVPPTVVVDRHGAPLHFIGDVNRYLSVAQGKADFSVATMCLPALRSEIKSVLHLLAAGRHDVVAGQFVRVAGEGQDTLVRIVGRISISAIDPTPRYMLTFEERAVGRDGSEADAGQDGQDEQLVQLRQELALTRDHMHALVEELETSNQELQTLNEELQVSTEELQSSNEELQASNEELRTVNEELHRKSSELSSLNDMLLAVQSSMQSALVVVDRDGLVQRFNPLAVRIFGLMDSDIGRPLAAMPATVSLPALAEQLKRVAHEGASITEPVGNGERHFIMQIAPFAFHSQPTGGAILTFTDVTEIRMAEAQLADTHERLKLAVESSNAGIWEWNIASNANTWSDEMWHLYGLEPGSVTPSYEAWRATVDPAFQSGVEEQLRNAAVNRTGFEVEWKTAPAMGPARWLMARGRPLTDAHGKVDRYIGVVIDISQRKQAEEALRRSQAQLRTFIDQAPVSIAMFDRNMNYLATSQIWLRQFGRGSPSLLGRNHYEVVPDMPEFWRQVHRQALAGEARENERDEWMHADGSRTWLRWAVHPWHDETGTVGGIIIYTEDLTERERALSAQRESQERFRLLMDNSPMYAWIVDREGRIVFVNRRYEERFGATLGALRGKTRDELAWTPETAAQMRASAEQALAGNRAVQGTQTIVLRDGTRMEWLLVKVPVTDENGQRLILGMALDVTEQRAAEDALRLSSERYRELIAHMLEGYARCRMIYADGVAVDFEYLEVNQAFSTLTGLTDVPGRRVSAVVPGIFEQRKWVLDFYEQCLRTGKPVRFETYLELAQRWLAVSAYPAGKDEFVAMFDDITQRRQAETEIRELNRSLELRVQERTVQLAEKERTLQSFLDAIPGMVGYWDRDQRNLFANRIYESWKGVPSGGLQNRTLRDVAGPRMYEVLRAHAEATLQGHPQRFEQGIFLPGNRQVNRLLTHYIPDIVGGEVRGFLTLAFDITKLKEAEELAEAASRAKSEFVANMSHEIRTPLNAVLGLAQMGQRQKDSRRAQEYFGQIVESGNHLLAIINDILDFSKIEAGKLELRVDQVDLARLIDEAVVMLAARAFIKGLRFSISEAAGLPRLFSGDATRCSQILLNLLSNAIKFTNAGSVRVEIACDADTLVLRVIDTGIGIDAAHLQRLFTPFEQGDASTTRRFGGTGLGLSITKHLVDMMHGTIRAESRTGAGSRFEVRLPAHDRVAPGWERLGTVYLVGLDEDEAHALEAAFAANGCSVMRGMPPAQAGGTLVIASTSFAALSESGIASLCAAPGLHCVVAAHPLDEADLPSDAPSHSRLCHGPLSPLRILLAVEAMPAAGTADMPGGIRLRGVRVLAAEDNELNQLVLGEMLADEGAEVTFAGDGAQAVESVRAKPDAYDIVLCDVEMPVMDGYAATRAIHALVPGLPVVGLTAHAFDSARASGKAAGMVDYLTKPFTLGDLVDTILRVLQGAKGSAEAQQRS